MKIYQLFVAIILAAGLTSISYAMCDKVFINRITNKTTQPINVDVVKSNGSITESWKLPGPNQSRENVALLVDEQENPQYKGKLPTLTVHLGSGEEVLYPKLFIS